MNEITNRVRLWRSDWNLYATEALGVTLDSEQQAILKAIQVNRRVSVRSGTSRGKDFLAAVAGHAFLYLNWPAKVINTAPTDRQVKLIMMPEIDRLYRNARFPVGGRMLDNGIRFKEKNHYLIGFKAEDKNTEAWSGFHSPNIMVVMTEASGLNQATFNAVEGILQGNSRLVLVFNPNQRSGEIYKSQTSPQYVKFHMNSLKAPNVVANKIIYPGQVDFNWVDERVKMPGWTTRISEEVYNPLEYDFVWNGAYYRPNDIFLIKVMGEFPREEASKLIPLRWVEMAQQRWLAFHKAPYLLTGKKCLGADIAGMGRDRTIICERQGEYVPDLTELAALNAGVHMATAGWLKEWVTRNQGPAFIDTIGEGAGVYSRLYEQGVEWAVSAKFSQGDAPKDQTGQLEFINLRAYCYWALRDWLNPANETGAMLPPDDELAAQIIEPKYFFNSTGKIQIEPKDEIKKRLGCSPDKADSLALSFWPVWPSPSVVKKTKAEYGFF